MGMFLCPAKVAPALSERSGWVPKKLSQSKSEVRAVGRAKTLIGTNGCLAEAITVVIPSLQCCGKFVSDIRLSVCEGDQT